MYRFSLGTDFLSVEEQQVFNDFLKSRDLDGNIWPVFKTFFESAVPGNQPTLLRIYEEGNLEGVVILLKCSNYGRALFTNGFLSGAINLLGIPFYLWIKFGCGMDMLSNPGFVRDPQQTDKVLSAAIKFLSENSLLTIVYDYSENEDLFPDASKLPSLPHGLVICRDMQDISDYTGEHKNLRKKLNRFRNKGGTYEVVKHKLDDSDMSSMKACFVSTAEKSVFYLPYQDIYLQAAINTSSRYLPEVYYFIARLNGKFIGYQAAVRSGKQLNALHGAFDRRLKSNYHAYNVLFVKMTEFAIEHGQEQIDFGAVLNVTKQRMINEKRPMSYFLMSKYRSVKWFFSSFLGATRIQSKDQLKFRE